MEGMRCESTRQARGVCQQSEQCKQGKEMQDDQTDQVDAVFYVHLTPTSCMIP